MKKHLFNPAKMLFSILALSFMVACWGDEPEPPTPPAPVTPVDPNPPTPAKDTNAPTITVSKSSVNIIAGPVVSISGSELKIGEESVATWKDDVSTSMKTELNFTPNEGSPKTINSGDKLSDEGKLQIKVTDEAGNSSTAEITLTRNDTKAPEITIMIQEKNVVAGVKVSIQDNQLFFDQEIAASWKDDYAETCTVELSIAGEKINSGDILFDAGTMVISVADEFRNKATAEFILTAVAITGLENLQNLSLQIDQEVNLLEGLTVAEGLTLQKVEMIQGNDHIQIENPRAFKPEYSGSIDIIFTLTRSDGSTIEVGVNKLTVMALGYTKVSISDMDPYVILPLYGIGPIERGDKNVYDYIDNLKIAETMRIREMMGKYGAGGVNPEEYLQLMDRLNYVMNQEAPDSDKYDNYGWIGESIEVSHSTNHHANNEMGLLIEFAGEYSKIKVIGRNPEKKWYWALSEFALNNQNSIVISCCSAQPSAYTQDGYREEIFMQGLIDAANLRNVVLFFSSGNTRILNWVRRVRLYNGEYESDPNWYYNYSSMANSDQNNYPNSHLLVSVWTNNDWHPDITNGEGSLFPVGFADEVLFGGFAFPYYSWYYNCFYGDPLSSWGWDSSYVNYINGCVLGLMFQLHADLESVDPLLEMARSTSLENSISLEGKTQKLQRLNPAGYFTKYCMMTDIPSGISLDETVSLNKEWYKGLLFNIPGAEVKVNGEWIPFTAENYSRIKSANPMNLEWRLNGTLVRKYGYTPGQTLQGKIITVDDQWNGLRLEKDITIQIN